MASSFTMRHLTSSTAVDDSLESSISVSPGKRSPSRSSSSMLHEPPASYAARVSYVIGGFICAPPVRQSAHAHDAHANAGTDTVDLHGRRDMGSASALLRPGAMAGLECAGSVGVADRSTGIGLLDDADCARSCGLGLAVGGGKSHFAGNGGCPGRGLLDTRIPGHACVLCGQHALDGGHGR